MTTIESLIERLEKATAPCREIDLEIGKALDHIDARTVIIGAGDLVGIIGYSDRNQWASVSLSLYTTSLDAAVSLCERVLPGWDWELSRKAALVINPKAVEGEEFRWAEIGANAALALCLATFRARAAIATKEVK